MTIIVHLSFRAIPCSIWTEKAKIGAVWSGLHCPLTDSLHNLEWRGNVRMRHYACAVWRESAHFADVRRYFFDWCGPCNPRVLVIFLYKIYIFVGNNVFVGHINFKSYYIQNLFIMNRFIKSQVPKKRHEKKKLLLNILTLVLLNKLRCHAHF